MSIFSIYDSVISKFLSFNPEKKIKKIKKYNKIKIYTQCNLFSFWHELHAIHIFIVIIIQLHNELRKKVKSYRSSTIGDRSAHA